MAKMFYTNTKRNLAHNVYKKPDKIKIIKYIRKLLSHHKGLYYYVEVMLFRNMPFYFI